MTEIKRYDGGSRELMEKFEEIYSLLMDVYAATGGKYPALEWLYEKPIPGEIGWKEGFRRAYRPFLKWRLENELDEVFAVEDGRIIGIIGINYDIKEKEVFEEYERLFREVGIKLDENSAFLEVLAVHPSRWKKGIGRILLLTAMERLRSLNKKGYGITFPDLYPAISLYDSVGGTVLGKVTKFAWSAGDKPADYLLISFS